MSLREEQCNKVCRILDDVLANRPTERDSLILAVRKAFAEPQERTGKWERKMDGVFCSNCHKGWDFIRGVPAEVETEYKFCPRCGKRMDSEQILSEADNDTAYGGLMSAT